MVTEIVEIRDPADSRSWSYNSSAEGVMPRVYQLYDVLEVANAILQRVPSMKPEVAAQIAGGEINRVRGLIGYHEQAYSKTLMLLRESGLIPEDFTMREGGPSAGLRLPPLPYQPRDYLAVDFLPQTAMFKHMVDKFQRAGLLPCQPDERYRIKVGDLRDPSLVLEGGLADVAYTVLTSQYTGSEPVFDFLNKNGRIGVNGDETHAQMQVTPREFAKGLLPFRSPYSGKETGVAYKIEGSSEETLVGDSYCARLILNGEFYNVPESKIAHIKMDGDNYTGGQVTITRGSSGEIFFEPWSLRLKKPDDVQRAEYMKGFLITLRELFRDINKATSNKWDSTAPLNLPVEAAEKGYYSIVLACTPEDHPLSAVFPLALMARYFPELLAVYKKGYLSQIGPETDGPDKPKRPFRDITHFQEMMREFLRNAGEINSKYEFSSPPHFASIMLRDEKDFLKLTNG